MTDAQRRILGLARKQFSLADLGDDWKDCYVEYTPLVAADMLDVQHLATEALPEDQGLSFIIKTIRNHFVKGQIIVIDESGANEVSPMEASDLELLPLPTLKDLYSEMNGLELDPKASAPAPALAPEQNGEPSSTTTP